MRKRFPSGRDFASAFGLANLLLIRSWYEFSVPLENAYFDYLKRSADGSNIAGLWLAALVLWIPMLVLIQGARNKEINVQKVSAFALITLVLIELNALFNMLYSTTLDHVHAKNIFINNNPLLIWLSLGAGTALILWLWLRHTARLVHATCLGLLVISPFPVAITSNLVNDLRHPSPRAESSVRLPSSVPSTPLSRVVILIFDELDYEITFEGKDAATQYPEFHNLRKHGLHATKAYPPSRNTLLSLPAYWLGKNVTDFEVSLEQPPMFKVFGEKTEYRLTEAPNLFSLSQALGAKSAIVGWSQPYCDLFKANVSECHQTSLFEPPFGEGVGDSLANALFRAGTVIGKAGVTEPDMFREIHKNNYKKVLEQSLIAVRDPELQLIFIHLPVPHRPVIFSKEKNEFVTSGPLWDGKYEDNLSLADQTIGALRQEMMSHGLWDRTNLLVASDHPFRFTQSGESEAEASGRVRVPFLLKPTGTRNGLEYSSPISARVLAPLALALLSGKLTRLPEVSRWLDRERGKDKEFLFRSYRSGKENCVTHPFRTARESFAMWTEFAASPCTAAH